MFHFQSQNRKLKKYMPLLFNLMEVSTCMIFLSNHKETKGVHWSANSFINLKWFLFSHVISQIKPSHNWFRVCSRGGRNPSLKGRKVTRVQIGAAYDVHLLHKRGNWREKEEKWHCAKENSTYKSSEIRPSRFEM